MNDYKPDPSWRYHKPIKSEPSLTPPDYWWDDHDDEPEEDDE